MIAKVVGMSRDMEYIARRYKIDLALTRPPRLSGQSISFEASRSDCYCLALPGRCRADSRWRAGLGITAGRKDRSEKIQQKRSVFHWGDARVGDDRPASHRSCAKKAVSPDQGFRTGKAGGPGRRGCP